MEALQAEVLKLPNGLQGQVRVKLEALGVFVASEPVALWPSMLKSVCSAADDDDDFGHKVMHFIAVNLLPLLPTSDAATLDLATRSVNASIGYDNDGDGESSPELMELGVRIAIESVVDALDTMRNKQRLQGQEMHLLAQAARTTSLAIAIKLLRLVFTVLHPTSNEYKQQALHSHPRYLVLFGIFLLGESFNAVAHELLPLVNPSVRAIKLGEAVYAETTSEVALIKESIVIIPKAGMISKSTATLLHLVSTGEIVHPLSIGQLELIDQETPGPRAKRRKVVAIELDPLVQLMRDEAIPAWGASEAVWVCMDTTTSGQLRMLEKLLSAKLPSKLVDSPDPLAVMAYAIQEVAKHVNDQVSDRQRAVQHLFGTLCTITSATIPACAKDIASLGGCFLDAIHAAALSGEPDVLKGVSVVLDALKHNPQEAGIVLAGQWVTILADAARASTIPAVCTVLSLVNVAARKTADWDEQLQVIAEHYGEQPRKLASIFRSSELNILHWLRSKDTRQYPAAITVQATESGYMGVDYAGFYLDNLDTANAIPFACIEKIHPSSTSQAAVIHYTFRKKAAVLEVSESYKLLADRWESSNEGSFANAQSPSASSYTSNAPSPTRSRASPSPMPSPSPSSPSDEASSALVRQSSRRTSTSKTRGRRGSSLRPASRPREVEPEDLEPDHADVVIPDGYEPPDDAVQLLPCPCVRTSEIAQVLVGIPSRGDWKEDLQPFLHGSLFIPPLAIYQSATVLYPTVERFKSAWDSDALYMKDSRAQPAIQVALSLWAKGLHHTL